MLPDNSYSDLFQEMFRCIYYTAQVSMLQLPCTSLTCTLNDWATDLMGSSSFTNMIRLLIFSFKASPITFAKSSQNEPTFDRPDKE